MSYNPFPQPSDIVVISSGSTVTEVNRFPVSIGKTGFVSINQGGTPVTFSNPLPVSLGSSNITITGDVNVGTTVSVTSTPENPIHTHITEIGSSGILQDEGVPYMPVGIGTSNLNLSYLPVGISSLSNKVSVSNTSFYVSGIGTSVSIANTSFYVSGVGSTVNVNITNQSINVGIGTTGSVSLNLNGTPVSSNNPLPVTGNLGISTTTVVSTTLPSTQTDAFNRIRTSNPLTLFDSSHRYRDNNLFTTLIVGSGSTVGFVTAQGLVSLNVGIGSTSIVQRETTKVFSYQPGKSLEVLNTFVMNQPQNHLSQRVGYYGSDNGIYFEVSGTTLNFVERSIVSGMMSETRTPQTLWLYDKLDGTGKSGLTLDPTKAQIFWMDIEWLGVGTVRVGFVIDGQFIHCHSFHHANKVSSTYITTGSLPIRYEIFNTGISTTGISTMKQICSTVISEGGYELRGLQQAVGVAVTSPIVLATAGTYYNLISLRLKSSPDRLDAIAILTALSVLGTTNNVTYNWQVRASGTSVGGSWISAGPDSAVEYKIDNATYTGGRILAQGYFNAASQGNVPVDILKEALFKFQLERDGLNKTSYELSLVCACDTNTSNVYASMDWEEISR